MTRRMNLRNLLFVFVVCILLVTGLQLIGYLFDETPFRFDLVTLLLLPGIFFLLILTYMLVTKYLVKPLSGRSPSWTDYRVRWAEYTIFFLAILIYTDLSDLILEEETYGAADLIATIVGSVLGGLLLAWVDPKEKKEEKSVEKGSTV